MHHKIQRRFEWLLRHFPKPLHDHLRNRRLSGSAVMGHRPVLAQRHHQGSVGPCARGRDVTQRFDACPSPGVACWRLAAKLGAVRRVVSHLLSPRPAFAGRRADGLDDGLRLACLARRGASSTSGRPRWLTGRTLVSDRHARAPPSRSSCTVWGLIRMCVTSRDVLTSLMALLRYELSCHMNFLAIPHSHHTHMNFLALLRWPALCHIAYHSPTHLQAQVRHSAFRLKCGASWSRSHTPQGSQQCPQVEARVL